MTTINLAARKVTSQCSLTLIQSVTLQQSGGVPTNQLTSVTTNGIWVGHQYDAAGNVTNDGTNTWVYDAENRIASRNGGTDIFVCDHQNRRVEKVTATGVTQYVWEGSQVIAEYNGSTGAVLVDYVYSGSRMIAKISGGTTQYFLSDRLSVRLVLDASGNVVGRQGHLPFGEDFGESGSQEKHHFSSYERDGESGTDYAVNRQYALSVGRFTQLDPVDGSVDNPQSLNRYSYVGNDPTNASDPLGLTPTHCEFDNGCWHCSTAFSGAGGSLVIVKWTLCSSGPGINLPPGGPGGNPTGNPGGGQGGGGTSSVDGEAFVNKFLKAKRACGDFFSKMNSTGDIVYNDGMLGQIRDRARSAFWNRLSMLPYLQNLTFAQAFGSGVQTGWGISSDDLIGVALGTGPDAKARAASLVNINGSGQSAVLLGLRWDSMGPEERNLVAIHEALHLAFYNSNVPYSGSHAFIVERLKDAGANISTTMDASAAINQWLTGGCPKK